MINDTKKAAKEAESLRFKQRNTQKKKGEPCRYLLNICSALAALPAPQELFVEALFAIDAHVITIPDTTLGATLRNLLPFEALSWNARPLLSAGLTE